MPANDRDEPNCRVCGCSNDDCCCCCVHTGMPCRCVTGPVFRLRLPEPLPLKLIGSHKPQNK